MLPSPINDTIAPRKLSAMEWLERRTQPYIVWVMSISAAVRTVYVFTDRIVDLTKLGAFNTFLNIITGIALALISDLTIVIAGRRKKLYTKELFNAKLARANARKSQVEVWAVLVEQLEQQVKANDTAMKIAMIMSIGASATYLVTSSGATGWFAVLTASFIAAYTLYLAYFHAVQTDEIKDDGQQEVADTIKTQLNLIRVEEIARIRSDFTNGATAMSVPARLALIAGGLSVPEQRRVMPTLTLLLRSADVTNDDEDDDDGTVWYEVHEVATLIRDIKQMNIQFESIKRRVRRKLLDHAEKYPEGIRMVDGRGWIVESSLALSIFDLPDITSNTQGGASFVEGTIASEVL